MEKTFKQQLELAREGGLSIFDLQVGLEVEDQLAESETLSHISDDIFEAVCGKVSQVYLKVEEKTLQNVVQDLISNITDFLKNRKAKAKDVLDIINNRIDKYGQAIKPKMLNVTRLTKEIEISDFWFYDENANSIFHVQQGTGDSLDEEDEEEGYCDYIYYDQWDFPNEDDFDIEKNTDLRKLVNKKLSYADSDDGGIVLLKKDYLDHSIEQIIYELLDFCYGDGSGKIANTPIKIIE